ncbi:GDSL esterase/lipase At2g30310-like isoform X2 [Punica granatum]|uniref:GDSL esterase/lipase At2g30310-like isoform X2 n=1 Tax=Punica granatum TaxID=22663 RepID=A0A6P8CVW2_PUNGR|nr:GDSL esterase/lipase At2g30310-like isoform X2 [Punica granatum]
MAPVLVFLIILIHLCVIIFIPAGCCGSILTSGKNSKFTAVLVFGDSTVDTGNNNYIVTVAKGDHPPYGRDFPGHIPTGRFSNGKLVPDFIASFLGIKDTVPPFLEPGLSNKDLKTGVAFASGGSGYDDLTTVVSGAIPVSQQLKYFKEYIQRLRNAVGDKDAEKIIAGALVIISAGTNDFILNFYDIPTRRLEFNISQYQDFLLARISDFVSELYKLGCRKLVIAGLPPMGCLPIQMTLRFAEIKDRKCVEDENMDAQIYNRKLAKLLSERQAELLQSKIVYADAYEPLIDMIHHPQKVCRHR